MERTNRFVDNNIRCSEKYANDSLLLCIVSNLLVQGREGKGERVDTICWKLASIAFVISN